MRRGGEDDELARIEWFGMKLRFRQSKTLFAVIPSRGLVTLVTFGLRITAFTVVLGQKSFHSTRLSMYFLSSRCP